MKKALMIILLISAVLLISFKVRFMLNNSYIRDFDNLEFNENKIKLLNQLNFYESYVAIKNYGDYYFKMAEYENAISMYDKALLTKMPQEKACDTRINACLAVFKLIDLNDKKNAIDLLKKAKSYVHDDDCLTLGEESSSKGDAEDMDETIDKTLEKMESGKPGDEPGDEPGDDPGDDPNQNPTQTKINEVQSTNSQGKDSRDKGMGRYQDGYDPYKGQNW